MQSSSAKFMHMCHQPQPIWMGIVNVTADSFSDGGLFLDPKQAVEHGMQMIAQGAKIIDFGAVSTNPKAQPWLSSDDVEYQRLQPVLQLARKVFPSGVLISVDTYCPKVAFLLAEQGLVDVINDVAAGRLLDVQYESTMHVATRFQLGFVAMHMTNLPTAKKNDPVPSHLNALASVMSFFQNRISIAKELGLRAMALDPGIGYGCFGKNADDIDLLLSLSSIQTMNTLNHPLLIGLSRKSFFQDLCPELTTPLSRDPISKQYEYRCIEYGVKIIRSHTMPARHNKAETPWN